MSLHIMVYDIDWDEDNKFQAHEEMEDDYLVMLEGYDEEYLFSTENFEMASPLDAQESMEEIQEVSTRDME